MSKWGTARKKAHRSWGDGCSAHGERGKERKFGEGGRNQTVKGFDIVKLCFCLVGSHPPVVLSRESVYAT